MIVHIRRGTAGGCATDILMMGHRGDVAHQLFLAEDGCGDGYVWQVSAALVGIVYDVKVTGLRNTLRVMPCKSSAEFGKSS